MNIFVIYVYISYDLILIFFLYFDFFLRDKIIYLYYSGVAVQCRRVIKFVDPIFV